METPRYSVIVPVYNVERYLAQCVGSVLAQRSSFECILVDDGSTDACPGMCDAFAELDSRVRVIHQANQGLAGARRTGVAAAKGEWLLFLDSDDYWPEGMLERLTEQMEQHPGFDLFVGSYLELDEDTGEIAPPGAVHLVLGEFESGDYRERVKRFYDSAHWSVWKLALRRSAAQKWGVKFQKSIIYAEDMPFDLDLLRHCEKMCFVDVIMVVYRANRRGSLMNVNLPKHFKGILASLRFFEPQFAGMTEPEREEILARLANSFWPDVRAAAARPKDERKKCVPLIQELRPLWNKGTQNRGRLDWSLYRILMNLLGPGSALAAGHLFQSLRRG